MFICIVILGVFFAIAFYLHVVMPFMRDRMYIKMEMQRSDARERSYWKKELKNLYLSHIPVIGRFYKH